ncbi:hypothetical protein GCM10007968_23950 [Sporolactobacillus putidus]|uniref:Uncharacterized protein n=1 Tax=Sporolactobacillus putidus TaxID=492735 RepID=A0A917W3E6_9BACL|nr:hypothetical protein GCM10007968_23950 [Sporolactobacillus putidus]
MKNEAVNLKIMLAVEQPEIMENVVFMIRKEADRIIDGALAVAARHIFFEFFLNFLVYWTRTQSYRNSLELLDVKGDFKRFMDHDITSVY